MLPSRPKPLGLTWWLLHWCRGLPAPSSLIILLNMLLKGSCTASESFLLVSSNSILKKPPLRPSPPGECELGDGGAVRESPLPRVIGWVSCFHRWRLRRESDFDCDTSGSEREIGLIQTRTGHFFLPRDI